MTVFAGFSRIPGADLLVDPLSLSRLVNAEAVPRRVRVKPGHSVLVGFDVLGSSGPGRRVGWIGAWTLPKKAERVLVRAAKLGAHVEEVDPAEAAIAPHVRILHGGLASDPKLARTLAGTSALGATAVAGLGPDAARIVRYNPARRVVLDAGESFVRIHAKDASRIARTAESWLARGLPTLPVRVLDGDGHVLASDRWGTSDLTTRHGEEAARVAFAVGESLTRMHASDTHAALDMPPHSFASPDASTRDTLDTLRILVPAATRELDDVANSLSKARNAVHPAAASGREGTELHGDLSPDQILVDGSDFRIIDLERAGRGPAAIDLGSWCAACTVTGRDDLRDPFLAGYSTHGSVDEDEMTFWEARFLLDKALDAVRSCLPGWPEVATARIAQAADARRMSMTTGVRR